MIFDPRSLVSHGIAQALRALGNPPEAGTTPGYRSRARDEGLVLDYIERQTTISETPASLAKKLAVHESAARHMLEYLARRGQLRRRVFEDIQPIYYRYPALDL